MGYSTRDHSSPSTARAWRDLPSRASARWAVDGNYLNPPDRRQRGSLTSTVHRLKQHHKGNIEMSEPVAGTWNCLILGGDANADDKDIIRFRVNAQITEGPDKGRKVTYEDQVNNKSAKYVVMSAKSVGWKGQTYKTFRADVDAWIKETGGASTVEIQHVNRKDGTIWGKARSIGRGPKPLREASQQSSLDADEALRRAMEETGNGNGNGHHDEPPPYDDVPPPMDSDEAPF